MFPFRYHQFLHESEGKERHSFTPLRQWLMMANILIKLQWMRLQHGMCNYVGIFCATQGMVNASNSSQAHGCALWMPQEAPDCFGDGKLIFLQFTAHWICEGAVCAHLALRPGLPRGKWRELLVCNPQIRKLILEHHFLLLKTRNSPGNSTHSSSKPELLKSDYVIQDLSLAF